MASPAFSYVLPLRMSRPAEAGDEMTAYLERLAGWCDDLIIIDGSPPEVFSDNARRWGSYARHLAPDPRHACLMGKVAGVLTGLDETRYERVVIADDDVRYERETLERVVRLLDDHDVVRPQNVFSSMPWHAYWDTARTLLNRSLGFDFPGTLAVRRSALRATGGYDGDVLFENLELIRTVQANGGRVVSPLDLFIHRLAPTGSHFWGQRTRQAYDDFALPVRMAIWLSVVPGLITSAWRRRPRPVMLAAAASVGLAEIGRRRGGGAAVFPARSVFLAPLWILERGVCSWLAVVQRARFGGVRYRDSVIRVAAHSPRQLSERAAVDKRGRSREPRTPSALCA